MARTTILTTHQRKAIVALIDQYQLAREKMDTALLKTILTTDVDQLVSNGEWRNGISCRRAGYAKKLNRQPGNKDAAGRQNTNDQFNRVPLLIADMKYKIQTAPFGKCGAVLS